MDNLVTEVERLDGYLQYLINGHKKLTGPMREALKNKVKDHNDKYGDSATKKTAFRDNYNMSVLRPAPLLYCNFDDVKRRSSRDHPCARRWASA